MIKDLISNKTLYKVVETYDGIEHNTVRENLSFEQACKLTSSLNQTVSDERESYVKIRMEVE